MPKIIKTTDIAKDRDFDENQTVLPTEVARGIYIENPPGAEALKFMHLLINRAGGRMADDTKHQIRLSDIKSIEGMRNHSRDTVRSMIIELVQAVMVFDDSDKNCEVFGGFIDRINLDHKHEVSYDILITWWFGGAFKEMAQKSCHWAILDRQTVFALTSKYSILLFQYITSMINLKYINSKTLTISEVRAILGVPEGKLKRWNDVNNFAIKPAIAEINHTSRLNLTTTIKKTGRSVVSITITWEDKDLDKKKKVKRELDGSSVGRKERRNGTEEVVTAPFPAIGSVRYTKPWQDVAAANCNWNHDKIADAFRSFCAGRNIRLDAHNIKEIFTNFCKKQKRI